MTNPNEAVLLIDALPLRSLSFVGTLDRLSHGDPTKDPVTLHTPDGVTPWIDAHANCEMLIYNHGAACKVGYPIWNGSRRSGRSLRTCH